MSKENISNMNELERISGFRASNNQMIALYTRIVAIHERLNGINERAILGVSPMKGQPCEEGPCDIPPDNHFSELNFHINGIADGLSAIEQKLEMLEEWL